MAVRRICCLPGDAVLRQKARRVPAFDSSLQQLIDDMLETMQQSGGVGLAAPQVGVSLRLVVIQMPDEEPIVLVNPEIVKRSGEREVVEGCLSIPGYAARIKRAISVTAKGRDRSGKEIRIKGEDLMAQALEHEIDHLDGILYIDHLANPDDLQRVVPEDDAGGM
jgi:peptide deformylase